MDVVVVIPVFNRAAILPGTLDSLARQSVLPSMVVVVDDGSSDGTAEAAEAWFTREERPFVWKVIRNDHGFAARARNRGVEEVGASPFVHFLDSDDLLPADFYERAAAAFNERPELGAVSADQRYTDAEDRPLRSRSLEGIAEDPSHWLMFQDAGILSVTVFRSELFALVGPFPTEHNQGEDSPVLFRAACVAKWGYLPGAPVVYRQFGDNVSRPSIKTAREWAEAGELYYPLLERSARETRWAISRRWMRAGRICREERASAEARDCFAHAIRNRPLYLDAYVAWLRSWFA